MEYILISVIVAVIATAVSFFIANKLNSAKYDIYIEQAKAKAKVIEHEAQVMLQDARHKAKIDFEKEFRSARDALEAKER